MAAHVLCILKHGPAGKSDPRSDEKHAAYLDSLRRPGMLASAGGFEGDPELYSACVFKTSFADETRRAMEQDPAVRSGRLAVEFHRWWTADRVLPWWGGRRFVIGQPSPPEQTRWHQAMRVLIVDDEPSIRRTTRVAVESSGHSASEAPNAAKAVKAAEEEGFDAVFLDLKLGADDGLEVLGRLMRVRPAPAVILFTAYANIATAVEAMRRGAFDFIPKPFTPDQIRSVLAKVAKAHALELRVQALESDLASGAPPVDLESAEPAMLRSLQVAFKAAETPANILILGSSGTGKSVLAREIHRRSARSDAAFVTVNCPSLSRELLESELFGHARGSFTGAVVETAGKVAAADGGTLFLDEIGELPLEIQPKLLRLLQEREYERVGEALPRRADVRVIAASNRDLAAEVKAGRFREDLFYRLNVIAVTLPGLRERPADLKRLADGTRRYFSMRAGKGQIAFSKAVSDAFAAYPWPGNLRELRNVVERAVILAPGDTIELADLPEQFSSASAPTFAVGARVTLDDLEAEHIRRVLAASRNLDDAARTLGIDPATLYRKRARLGLL